MTHAMRILSVAAAGVLVAGAAPAAAKTAPRGINYGGQSSQDDPVVIVLSKDHRHVVTVGEEFEADCASGGTIARLSRASAYLKISASGRFAGVHMRSGPIDGQTIGSVVSIVAKVKGRTMTGTLDYDAGIIDAQGQQVDSCHASATFKATASKRKVYAGFTSQDGPVVAELNGSRTRVHHLHVGWQSTCKPDGFFQVGDTLWDVPIQAGTFGTSFTTTSPEGTAEPEANAYSVAGRLTKTKLSGSIDVKTQEFDAAGAMTYDCDTGNVSFRGATG